MEPRKTGALWPHDRRRPSCGEGAIGGENVTTTVEGRERYPVNVRYQRAFRGDTSAIGHVLVPAMNGQQQIPINQLADVKLVAGPSMYRDENGMLSGYVYVDVAGRDIGSYVNEAKQIVSRGLQLPAGYTVGLERTVRSHGPR